VTVFGRKRHDPGDDLNNIIQHASRALVARVTEDVKHLRNGCCLNTLKPQEWQRLLRLQSLLETPSSTLFDEARLTHLNLCDTVMAYAKSRIDLALDYTPNAEQLSMIDNDRASYVEAKDFRSMLDIYEDFNDVQKILCPFIYHEMYNLFSDSDPYAFPSAYDNNNLGARWAEFRNSVTALRLSDSAVTNDPQWQQYFPPYDVFSPSALRAQLVNKLEGITRLRLRIYEDPPILMSSHLLLHLEYDEMKYLPLWADGNDDGTGGVFEESLPPALYGPSGPGPAYHTGHTLPSNPSDASSDAASISGSVLREIEAMRLGSTGSTVGPGSVDVQDSISTVFNRQKVEADDMSIDSEAFSDATTGEFARARFAVPEGHQEISGALATMVESATDDDEYDVNDDNDDFLGWSDDEMADGDVDDESSSVVPGPAAAATSGPLQDGEKLEQHSVASDKDGDLVII